MIVVIVIVGILSLLAYSGWRRVQWRIQVLGAADEFRNALLLARADALTRQRNSGFELDPTNLQYRRFVDSSGVSGAANGSFDNGEIILQAWTALPAHMVFDEIKSTISSDPEPRPCNSAATPTSSTVHSGFSGTYSVVFHPDGRCWASFRAKFGISTFPDDTFLVTVLPATGLVTMEH